MVTFLKNIEKFFGIPAAQAFRFVDPVCTNIRRRPTIDPIVFDCWLHEQFGEYEEAGLSMAQLITSKFGPMARDVIRRSM